MSIINEYNQKVRESLGLSEVDAAFDVPDDALQNMTEQELNAVLEKVNARLNKLSEEQPSGPMEDLNSATNNPVSEVPPVAGPEDDTAADEVYFEMLNHLRERVNTCEEAAKKTIYKKTYEMWHKMRDKVMKEMITQ